MLELSWNDGDGMDAQLRATAADHVTRRWRIAGAPKHARTPRPLEVEAFWDPDEGKVAVAVEVPEPRWNADAKKLETVAARYEERRHEAAVPELLSILLRSVYELLGGPNWQPERLNWRTRGAIAAAVVKWLRFLNPRSWEIGTYVDGSLHLRAVDASAVCELVIERSDASTVRSALRFEASVPLTRDSPAIAARELERAVRTTLEVYDRDPSTPSDF